MIYNASQIGDNTLTINDSIPEDYVLALMYVPCNNKKSKGVDKYAIMDSINCGLFSNVYFTGVYDIYEDLDDGMVSFDKLGTWTFDLYYQDNDINLNPDNATFLETIKIQIA